MIRTLHGGELMPDYNDFDWEGMRIRIKPVGWRGWRILAPVKAKKWPYFSGTRPKFTLSLTPMSKRRQWRKVTLDYALYGPDTNTVDYPMEAARHTWDKPGSIHLDVPWLSATGPYQFRGKFDLVTANSQTNDGGLVNFDVKSCDTLTLLIFGIAMSSIITIAASVGGGYRGGLVCLNSAARFDKWNHAAVR